jgi:O-Antigen ligase
VAMMVAGVAAIALAGPVRRQVVGVALLGIVLVAAFYSSHSPPNLSEGGASRQDLWMVAGHVVRDHPVFGVGAGNYQVVEPGYALANLTVTRADLVTKPEVVHNTYLHITAEYGAIGVLLFLVVVAGGLLVGLRAARQLGRSGDRQMEIIGRGLIVASVAMFAAFFFISAQYQKQLWLMLGLAAALHAVVLYAPAPSPAPRALGALRLGPVRASRRRPALAPPG